METNAKKGLFITTEGIDGSGKTTALTSALTRLKEEGYQITSTREPGGSRISELIRDLILNKKYSEEDPRTEALLYAASRRQYLVDVVFPLLKQGKIIVSDRYVDSSLAYQGYGRELGVDRVYQINMFATEDKLPDLTIYFDIKPEQALKRIASGRQDKEDRLDSEAKSFHQRVYQGYAELIKRFKDRYVIVDATKSRQEVANDVYKILKNKIDEYLKG